MFANFGGAKRLMVGSDPPGLLTSSETFPETNSSYTHPNKNGLSNGHYFSHWEINGVRQADNQGLGLSQISLSMNEDKTVIAKYYPENEDTDADGVPDWFECMNLARWITMHPAIPMPMVCRWVRKESSD